MAEIQDIEKLRPELLTMSVAELERRKAEIDMAISKKAAIEAEERKKEELVEAQGIFERLVKDISRLYEIGKLPPRLVNALSKESGEFSPGLYLKKPRA